MSDYSADATKQCSVQKAAARSISSAGRATLQSHSAASESAYKSLQPMVQGAWTTFYGLGLGKNLKWRKVTASKV